MAKWLTRTDVARLFVGSIPTVLSNGSVVEWLARLPVT
jgi:hypothetical protein